MTIGLADARGALPMGKRLLLLWQQISPVPEHKVTSWIAWPG
jgi:hypothetical protein